MSSSVLCLRYWKFWDLPSLWEASCSRILLWFSFENPSRLFTLLIRCSTIFGISPRSFLLSTSLISQGFGFILSFSGKLVVIIICSAALSQPRSWNKSSRSWRSASSSKSTPSRSMYATLDDSGVSQTWRLGSCSTILVHPPGGPSSRCRYLWIKTHRIWRLAKRFGR